MEGVGPQMWLELRRVKMLTRSLRYELENYHCLNIIEGNLELFHIIIFRCSREWPGVSSPQSIPHRRSSSSLLLIISFQEYVVITSQISSHDEKERSLSNLAHCKFNPPLQEKYGDRFIPSRAGNNWQVNFNMIQVLFFFKYIYAYLVTVKHWSSFSLLDYITTIPKTWDCRAESNTYQS